MGWASHLPKMARTGVSRITVAVTEQTARRVLKLKDPAPLQYSGIPLNCIGSSRWRRRVRGLAQYPPVREGARCEGCRRKVPLVKAVCESCMKLAGILPREPSSTSSAGNP